MKCFILVLAVALAFYLVKISNRSKETSLIAYFGIAGITIYSGLGICIYNLENKYIISFVMYLLVYVIVYLFAANKHQTNASKVAKKQNDKYAAYKLSAFLCIVYLLLYFVYLIFPINRLSSVFNPPTWSIVGIIERTISVNSGLTGAVFSIQTILKPFFYIYAYKLWEQNKRVSTILLIIIDFYLNALKYSYFGRTDVVIMVFMIALMTSYRKKALADNGDDKKAIFRIIRNIGIVLLIISPFLVSYVSTRAGVMSSAYAQEGAIRQLITSECYYPKYYEMIINKNIRVSVSEYVKWLLSLPIPSAILPIDTVSINTVFTSTLYNTRIVTALSLPSILGEAFILNGEYFFIMHAAFLAAITGIAAKMYEKRSYLCFYSLYIALRNMAMGRGGSQGFISSIVSTVLLLAIIELLDKHTTIFRYKMH